MRLRTATGHEFVTHEERERQVRQPAPVQMSEFASWPHRNSVPPNRCRPVVTPGHDETSRTIGREWCRPWQGS